MMLVIDDSEHELVINKFQAISGWIQMYVRQC